MMAASHRDEVGRQASVEPADPSAMAMTASPTSEGERIGLRESPDRLGELRDGVVLATSVESEE